MNIVYDEVLNYYPFQTQSQVHSMLLPSNSDRRFRQVYFKSSMETEMTYELGKLTYLLVPVGGQIITSGSHVGLLPDGVDVNTGIGD